MESHTAVAVTSRVSSGPSVFARNQFLIKRVFSLSGLFFGGYVVVHLLTNASVLAGVAMFQMNVDRIHSLGPALPLVEWTFLFIPILFHALVGWAIIFGAVPNLSEYRFVGNIRYTLQRVTAIILFVFILGHVLHMHHLGAAFGGGKFKPEQAASSMAAALQPALWIQLFYAMGVFPRRFTWAMGYGRRVLPGAYGRHRPLKRELITSRSHWAICDDRRYFCDYRSKESGYSCGSKNRRADGGRTRASCGESVTSPSEVDKAAVK